jgi:hypothetical protein
MSDTPQQVADLIRQRQRECKSPVRLRWNQASDSWEVAGHSDDTPALKDLAARVADLLPIQISGSDRERWQAGLDAMRRNGAGCVDHRHQRREEVGGPIIETVIVDIDDPLQALVDFCLSLEGPRGSVGSESPEASTANRNPSPSEQAEYNSRRDQAKTLDEWRKLDYERRADAQKPGPPPDPHYPTWIEHPKTGQRVLVPNREAEKQQLAAWSGKKPAQEPPEFEQRAEAAKQIFWSESREGKSFEEAKAAALRIYEFSPEFDHETREWSAGTEAGERRAPLTPGEKKDHDTNLEGLRHWFDRWAKRLDQARAPGGIYELQLGAEVLALLVLAKMLKVEQIQELSNYGLSQTLGLPLDADIVSQILGAVNRWAAKQQGSAAAANAPAAEQRAGSDSREHVEAPVAIADTPASVESQARSDAAEREAQLRQRMADAQAEEIAKRRQFRSEWLTERLAGRPLKTVTAHAEGPSDNTLRRWRSGVTTNQDAAVRGQLAKVFDWPVGSVPL